MILKEFIEKFIEPNSIIRLVYKTKGGHKLVLSDWCDTDMEWKIIKGQGKYISFINHNVTGITSIWTSICPEAINIVIEEIPLDILRNTKLDSIL